MTANRQKNAWIWLAVAAIAVATLVRAQEDLPKGTAFANPVLQFLSAHANGGALSALGAQAKPGTSSARAHRSASADHGSVWMALLPIFFVGLLAPLTLCPRVALRLGRAPSAPALSCLFQCPPPALAL